jgi:hypothetical protein
MKVLWTTHKEQILSALMVLVGLFCFLGGDHDSNSQIAGAILLGSWWIARRL